MMTQQAPAIRETQTGGTHQTWLAAVLLALLIVAAFSPAIGHGVIWDDGDYLLENRLVKRPSGPGWIWLSPEMSSGQYHPLTLTTFWAEWRLWGPWMPGYHATNILLHACAGLLAWRVFLRLGLRAPWIAAAVFALHPIAVESVAWVAERKNILAMLFGLLSILSYLRMRKVGSENQHDPIQPWKLYAFSLVALGLSLTSKPVFCGVPVIIAILLWMKRRLTWQDVALLLPHLLAAAGMAWVCSYFETHYAGAKGPEFALPPRDRIVIAGLDTLFYTWKFLVPYPLYQGYPKWDIPAMPWPTVLIFPAILAAVGALAAAGGKIGRGWAAGLAAALVGLAPALGFVSFYPMAWSYVEDHYAFFMLPPAAALVVELGAWALRRPPARRIAAAAALAALVGLTAFQSSLYRSGERLWRHSLKHHPDGWVIHMNLANTLMMDGRPVEALVHARRAAELVPENLSVRMQVVMALELCGRLDEAIAELDTIIALQPRNTELQEWRGAITNKKRLATGTQPATR